MNEVPESGEAANQSIWFVSFLAGTDVGNAARPQVMTRAANLRAGGASRRKRLKTETAFPMG